MNIEEWSPGKILETSGGYWRSCVLHAGVRLDVFTAIGKDWKKVEQMSRKGDADSRASSMLMNALTAMCLLTKEDERYANTETGCTFLSKESDHYIGYIIQHRRQLVGSWSKLDESVRTGRPMRTRATQLDDEARESFLMGMFNIAMLLAPRLVKQLDLSDRRHLIDVGGGPGTYAIQFCQNNPELIATVYDLPASRPFAEKTIEQFGLSDRIDFCAGNFVDENIPGSYDAAWLSHILHGEGPAECRRLLQKTVGVLQSGGLIIVHDFLLNETMDGPVYPAVFSLNMLLGTEAGQSYSEKQIKGMLKDVGVRDTRRVPFDSPNDSGVITGIVR